MGRRVFTEVQRTHRAGMAGDDRKPGLALVQGEGRIQEPVPLRQGVWVSGGEAKVTQKEKGIRTSGKAGGLIREPLKAAPFHLNSSSGSNLSPAVHISTLLSVRTASARPHLKVPKTAAGLSVALGMKIHQAPDHRLIWNLFPPGLVRGCGGYYPLCGSFESCRSRCRWHQNLKGRRNA